jgi:transcriptional regulator with XRE-family HTH domain
MQKREKASLAVQLGQRARKIRQMRGLTQKALAARLVGRVDYSYIGKIERGEQLPSLKVLHRMGEALNVPFSYFFSEEAWTELLPEEIRRLRWPAAQAPLLRETIELHPEDIPLVQEIVRILVRHRHRAGPRRPAVAMPEKGREPAARPAARVAEARPTYGPSLERIVASEAAQRIREVIQSLGPAEGERLVDVRRRLKQILEQLTARGQTKRGK